MLIGMVALAAVPLTLVAVVVGGVLATLGPLISKLSALLLFASSVVALYFSYEQEWAQAMKAAILALLSGSTMMAVIFLAGRLGLDLDSPPSRSPPWWWYQ
ncbi:hypothetical protein [Methylobacterium radiotolerans]|uniref:hypothetical protein n=1 Tax=Methylobacterium radiotolerans TaxID=31998 RepID=UPI0011157BEF|nr:hypothetical protein [Methylobacterium radiotolerans]